MIHKYISFTGMKPHKFSNTFSHCIIQEGYVQVCLTGVPYMPINVNNVSMQANAKCKVIDK